MCSEEERGRGVGSTVRPEELGECSFIGVGSLHVLNHSATSNVVDQSAALLRASVQQLDTLGGREREGGREGEREGGGRDGVKRETREERGRWGEEAMSMHLYLQMAEVGDVSPTAHVGI